MKLIDAIKTGSCTKVIDALNSGEDPNMDDGQGHPGFPLAMASFLGHVFIVQELIRRGANVNPEGATPELTPLGMAIRGKKLEAVRFLIEMGAVVPKGVETGLRSEEVIIAQEMAYKDGRITQADLRKSYEDTSVITDSSIEIITVYGGVYGVDTQILESEMIPADLRNRK